MLPLTEISRYWGQYTVRELMQKLPVHCVKWEQPLLALIQPILTEHLS